MRNTILPLAISLFAPICLAALQTPHSTEAPFEPGARPLQDPLKRDVPESCTVTKPPAQPFVPPSPYPNNASASAGYFSFGTNKLWIYLRTDGTWQGLPQWADGSLRQKLIWWREGYDWHRNPHPPLQVTGSRLNSPAPPIQSGVSHGWTNDSNHPFITNGINLPALGCWKITGRFGDDAELSFVVWVTQ
jgi:hypothetical protein